jgi:hypothetical protein
MSRNEYAILLLGLGLVAGFFGIQVSTTQTMKPTADSEVSVTTSEEGIGASGQNTQYRPDGKSTTSFEAELNQDGGKVKVTQENEFKAPEIEKTLDDAERIVVEGTQELEDKFNEVTSLIGQ